MRKSFTYLFLSVMFIAPSFVLADHNTAHTIAQLQERIQALNAQIQALKTGSVVPQAMPSQSSPPRVIPSIQSVSLPPIFDNDTSDDDIVQLNNLRISDISGGGSATILAIITASYDFGVVCRKFDSPNSARGAPFPCPLRKSVFYTIRVDNDTRLLLRNRQKAGIGDFGVGDRINVYGFMDRDTYAVDALVLRNLDKPAARKFIQLNNVEVLARLPDGATPTTLTVVQRGANPCYDYGDAGQGKASVISCPFGLETKEKAEMQKLSTNATAVQETPPQLYYRKYDVEVNAKTVISDRNRTLMNVGDISVGDILNIYGTQKQVDFEWILIEGLVVRDLSKPTNVGFGTLNVFVRDGGLDCGGLEGSPLPCGILYNAKVGLYSDEAGVFIDSKSTEKGVVVFENLKLGGYSLVVSAPGFNSTRERVVLNTPGGFQQVVMSLAREVSENIKVSVPSSFSLVEGQTALVTNYNQLQIYLRKILPKNYGPFTNQNVDGVIREVPPIYYPPRVRITVSGPGGCGPNADPLCLGGPAFSGDFQLNQGDTIDAAGLKITLNSVVFGDFGNRKSASFSISTDGKPTANNAPKITAFPAIGSNYKMNLEYAFTWIAEDVDGDKLSWSTSWGDGTGVAGGCLSKIIDSTGVSPNPPTPPYPPTDYTAVHTWSKPGVYLVRTTVNDCRGGSDTHEFKVQVGESVVKPSIQVLSPNGGETWAKGTTQTIKWQDNTVLSTSPPCQVGTICTQNIVVRLYDIRLVTYYPPCTACEYPYTAPYRIANGVYGPPFNWSVGKIINAYGIGDTAPDGSYTVQVCKSGTDICDSSDSYFKIISVITSPSITVFSPNGGEVWHPGETHRVSWNSIGLNSVKIYVYDPAISGSGSTLYITPNNNPIPASQGYFDWTIGPFGTVNGAPGSGGSNYRIRVDDAASVVPSDTSDAPFSIVSSASSCNILDVYAEQVPGFVYSYMYIKAKVPLDPAGYKISGADSWNGLGFVAIESGTDGVTLLKSSQTLNSVAVSYILARKSTITLVNANEVMTCNTIVSQNLPPSIGGVSGPTTLKIGETGTWKVEAKDPEGGALSYKVYWGDDGAVVEQFSGPSKGSLTIGFATFTHSYAKAGFYNPTFVVTDDVNLSAKTSMGVTVGEGVVKPLVTVISPNGGETWGKGKIYTITWHSVSAPTVMVDLVRPGYEYHLTGPNGDVANNGFLNYWVPQDLPEAYDYKIKVMHRVNAVPVAQDSSDAPFSIVGSTSGAPSFTITSPYAGEQWSVGSRQTVKWYSNNISASYVIGVIRLRNAVTGQETAILGEVLNDGVEDIPMIPTSLEPGKYTLEIKTIINDQTIFAQSESFSITKPSYYPGFFMSTDKTLYASNEVVYLKLSRADGANESFLLDFYAMKTGAEKKVLLQKALVAGGSTVQKIALNEWAVFNEGGAGEYIFIVCTAGEVCAGGTNTNSIAFKIQQ